MTRQVRAACIGASAGGVDALLALLKPLPAGFGLPLVVVLHVPEDHDSVLAEVFQHHLALPVREARDKEGMAGGGVFFAPAGYHLLVEADASFSLSCEPPLNHSRPSIDLLFDSAAAAWGRRACGLLLTGANHDGAEGLAAIAAAGGVTAVQDPAEAAVATMPLAALKRDATHPILPLDGIFALLMELEKNHV